MMLRFRLTLAPDDNGTILVTSPDFPLVTYGHDEVSALRNAVDATEVLLASMMEAKEAMPCEGPEDGSPRVRLPLQTVLKVSLYDALRSRGMTRADLQRKLGWQRESVDRLFRLDHNSRIEQIDEAFRALGKAVTPAIEDVSTAA